MPNSPEALLVGFAHALSVAGLPVTPDRTHTFIDAASRLGVGRSDHVYWAGRATFCSCPDDIAGFTRTFEAWFRPGDRDDPHREHEAPSAVPQAALQPGDDSEEGDEALAATVASAEETLRHRDVATMSEAERAVLARQFASLPVRPPLRRARRTEPYVHGDIDAVRTMRDQLRRAGEPGPLRYRRNRLRQRRLVLLIDVSGSMKNYADSLLRLAHRIVHGTDRTTEVFTLGTRLTRVTPALRTVDPDRALLLAGEAVPDWSGGTRLGDVLGAFLDRWGRRGMARGAVIVIASDGWERGDPERLAEQMRRLSGVARKIVWSNPHRGKAGFEPTQGGMAAALPHVDSLVAGHSLAAFTQLVELIGDA